MKILILFIAFFISGYVFGWICETLQIPMWIYIPLSAIIGYLLAGVIAV